MCLNPATQDQSSAMTEIGFDIAEFQRLGLRSSWYHDIDYD
jgi:hypothetical protein